MGLICLLPITTSILVLTFCCSIVFCIEIAFFVQDFRKGKFNNLPGFGIDVPFRIWQNKADIGGICISRNRGILKNDVLPSKRTITTIRIVSKYSSYLVRMAFGEVLQNVSQKISMVVVSHPQNREVPEMWMIRQAAELLLDFGAGDPYDLCTAYLLLCEQGHALAHLNTLTAAVLAYANSRLPFSSEALFIESHIIDKDADADYTMHEIKGYWSDTPDTNPYTDRITYGQALYACADIIPPRTGNISQELVDELQEYGIPEAMAHEIAMITHLFHHTQYRDINFGELLEVSSLEELKRITEPSGEASPAELTPEEKLAAAEKQIDALTQKVIMLQQALSATEREQQKLQKQLETTESSAAADHDELIALRETIFRMQSAEEEPSPDDSITFPYTTTRRICVFGGHDTWRKAIKPMLPEVRFYDRDTLPRPEVIRYADIVWIQPNAISHGNYYSIINAAREHKVPVRYFGYASARKCAEELVGVEKSI